MTIESEAKPDFTKAPDIKAYLYEELGLCGCTELVDVIYTVRKALLWLAAGTDRSKKEPYETLFKDGIGVFYLVMNAMENANLCDHGGSIRNAWLTQDGEALLKGLQEFTPGMIDAASGVAYNGCSYL